MIHKLLLDHIAIPEANIHRIEAELEPTIAAERYESHIRTFFDGEQETFDLTLLGIGTDGHMASLYPGEPTVTETTRWVVPGAAPDELQRVTLTAPALLTSANIMFIVTGKNKAPALQQVLQGSYNPEKYPAQLIAQSDHPHTIWVVDSDAASMLG
jgi:6-phosphogluconolactonase